MVHSEELLTALFAKPFVKSQMLLSTILLGCKLRSQLSREVWVSGGLFIIALPGFISLLAVYPLPDAVLSHVSGLAQTGELTVAVVSWSSAYIGVCKPKGLSRLRQNAWDVEAPRVSFVSLLNSVDQVTRVRLLAAATKENRIWLHAVPVPSFGNTA